MIPSRIVPDILLDQPVHVGQLALCLSMIAAVPQAETIDQPLPVTPDVVVLAVLLEHLGNEVGFAIGRVQAVDNELAVVPDLVVLLVGECGFVQPVQLLVQIGVCCGEDLGAVEPAGAYCISITGLYGS